MVYSESGMTGMVRVMILDPVQRGWCKSNKGDCMVRLCYVQSSAVSWCSVTQTIENECADMCRVILTQTLKGSE